MILFVTDFGNDGPYVAQMKAAVRRNGYQGDILNLFSDIPTYNIRSASVLLNAYAHDFPEGCVFVSVVDPGVGSDRLPLAILADGRWYVGPDNGLFELVLRRAIHVEAFKISWQPARLSASFHGRDVFAPIAARIARGQGASLLTPMNIHDVHRVDWPDDLSEIVYVDHFGNAMTGIENAPGLSGVKIGGEALPLVRTFSDVEEGAPLAYINANGILEISVNQGRADTYFGIEVGDAVTPIWD